MDILIERIKLPELQARNEALLKEDKEVLELAAGVETDDDDEPIQDFNQDEDLELAKALEDAYLTPPPTDEGDEDEDSPCAFYVKYPLNQAAAAHQSFPRDHGGERDPEVQLDSTLAVELDSTLAGRAAWQEPSQTLFQPRPKSTELESAFNIGCQDICQVSGQDIGQDHDYDMEDVFKGDRAIKESFTRAQEDRFIDFIPEKITSTFHGAFLAGRRFKDIRLHKKNLPPPPQSLRDLETHPFREQFIEAQRVHLESHRQMKSFQETDKKHAKGQQVLSSMWVFVYKTDKHGFLQKCKARLVVCGNQQALGDLPTRATTLASASFRTLMAITAKFDLETIQMDAVNAFVHCDLDEVVYMKMPPGYTKKGKVLRLRKALYGLRRSPLLWQKNLTNSLKELGFKEVP